MTDPSNEFSRFIKRNPVARIISTFIINILILTILLVILYEWIILQFGFLYTALAIVILSIILTFLLYVLFNREIKIKEEILQIPSIEPLGDKYKGLIISVSLIREPKEQIMQSIKNIKDEFLFSWNEVPGPDSNKLLSFLINECDVSLSENVVITKSVDSKTIFITEDENIVKIVIDKDGKTGSIILNDGYIYNLELKMEKDKSNIYVIDKGLYKIFKVRGVGQTFRAIKHHCGKLEKCWMLCSGDVEDSQELVDHFINKFSKNTAKAKPIPLDNPNNIIDVYNKIDMIYTKEIKVINLDETDVIADLTGGTALMSCAMIFACRSPKRDLEYVEQNTYNLNKIKENVAEIEFHN